MTPQERYERFQKQPDYLKTYVQGLSEAKFYSVILESEKFAIIKRDGHSWYRGPYGGSMAYAQTEYQLISKSTKNYWVEKSTVLFKGRLTKNILTKLTEIVKTGVINGL